MDPDEHLDTYPSDSATFLPHLFEEKDSSKYNESATDSEDISTDDGVEYRYLDDFEPSDKNNHQHQETDHDEQKTGKKK